jgi:hypothetical protein
MHTSLVPGSMTITGGEGGQQAVSSFSLLQSAAEALGATSVLGSRSAAASSGLAVVKKEAGEEPNSSPLKGGAVDVRIDRGNAARGAQASLKKANDKMCAVLVECASALQKADVKEDADLVVTLDERMVLVGVVMGVVVVAEADGKLVCRSVPFIDKDSINAAVKFTYITGQQDGISLKRAELSAELQKLQIVSDRPLDLPALREQAMVAAAFKKAVLLPVDNPDKLMSVLTSTTKLEEVKMADNAQVLEQLSTDFEHHLIGMSQLDASLKKALKSLKGVVAKRETTLKRKEVDKKKADANLADANLAQRADQAAKRMKFSENAKVFQLDWTKAGHPSVVVFPTEVEFDKSLKDAGVGKPGYIFDRPFVLGAGTAMLKDLLKQDGDLRGKAQAPKLLDQWEAEEGFAKATATKDAVQHTFTGKQLPEALTKCWDFVFPRGFTCMELPSTALQKSIEECYLFGYAGTMVRHWFEADFLACARIVTKGTLKVLRVAMWKHVCICLFVVGNAFQHPSLFEHSVCSQAVPLFDEFK